MKNTLTMEGGTMMPANYAHNVYDEATHSATSTMKKEVLVVNPSEVPGAVFLLPTPKSPHGCDVDPSGEYIVGNGKFIGQLNSTLLYQNVKCY